MGKNRYKNVSVEKTIRELTPTPQPIFYSHGHTSNYSILKTPNGYKVVTTPSLSKNNISLPEGFGLTDVFGRVIITK
jgi:hypothetical protein